jgi:hypothetical protein
LYGYEANSEIAPKITDGVQSEAVDIIQTREAQLSVLKKHLAAAQNRMKVQADRHIKDRQFQVGEQVLLKLQPYTQ